MSITIRNPNPQQLSFSAYEGILLKVMMKPPLTTPWPGGATFILNIRDDAGNVVVQSSSFVVLDAVNGVVQFTLTSTQTGELDVGGGDSVSSPVGGDFLYDCWRTDTGSEKRLAWGPLIVLAQQWQPVGISI